MDIKKYASRLEYATLYKATGKVWKTIHSRWDVELFKLLFVEEEDEITLDTNTECLKRAVTCIFGLNDEKLTISLVQTMYNIISVNNIIPIDIVHGVVSKNIPSGLGPESQGTIHGVIMPTSLLMHGKTAVAEELSLRAELMEPQNADTCYHLALNSIAFGKTDKAIMWCTKAIALDNDNGEILYTRACLHLVQGNIEMALNDLRTAVRIDDRYSRLAREQSYFEAIRNDERFMAITKEKGLSDY